MPMTQKLVKNWHGLEQRNLYDPDPRLLQEQNLRKTVGVIHELPLRKNKICS